FFREVPANWDETQVLHAEMGKCLVVARRRGTVWYVGGMTANQPCTVELNTEFLGDGPYHAELYFDDSTAGPQALNHRQRSLSAGGAIRVDMPRAGGFVARIAPADPK